MKAIRNLFAILLCLVMVFSLAACGTSPSSAGTPASEAPEPETSALPSAELPDAVLTEPEENRTQEETTEETALDRAKAYIDRPLSELKEEFGEPNSASYVSSCYGFENGKDGELVYDDFIVITYQTENSETVTYVEPAA